MADVNRDAERYQCALRYANPIKGLGQIQNRGWTRNHTGIADVTKAIM